MLAYHRRLLAFDHWANLETLAAVTPIAARVPQSVAWLAHIMAAKRLWFARVAGTTPPFTVNPALGVDALRAEFVTAHDEWQDLLATRADADLAGIVRYQNTRGDAFESTLGDILTHLPIHGQHHRGQIAAHLRVSSGVPPVIDFIHAARSGHLAVTP
ncbi:MAG: DinB family protein [Vicinamibacterales bacterium]|nr:DinB family protein [Vicinamibacterales bacterium]